MENNSIFTVQEIAANPALVFRFEPGLLLEVLDFLTQALVDDPSLYYTSYGKFLPELLADTWISSKFFIGLDKFRFSSKDEAERQYIITVEIIAKEIHEKLTDLSD